MFGTEKLGAPLAVGKYDNAERAPFATPGHPGLDVSGDGRGCNKIQGSFEVFAISWSVSILKSFTATFEQHCDGIKPALRGCVHYQQ